MVVCSQEQLSRIGVEAEVLPDQTADSHRVAGLLQCSPKLLQHYIYVNIHIKYIFYESYLLTF